MPDKLSYRTPTFEPCRTGGGERIGVSHSLLRDSAPISILDTVVQRPVSYSIGVSIADLPHDLSDDELGPHHQVANFLSVRVGRQNIGWERTADVTLALLRSDLYPDQANDFSRMQGGGQSCGRSHPSAAFR